MREQIALLNFEKTLDMSPTFFVQDAFIKARTVVGSGVYENVVVSVSGGWDSDVVVDIMRRVPHDPDAVYYVFFDTGMEFQATKDHLDDLEKKYGITIHRERAVVPVPLGVRKHGQPFLSKQVSEFIERLQRHGFKWEDRPFEELYAEYPRCKAALRWWCNAWYDGSRVNISKWPWLKEFMVANPPTFRISPKCCDGAKKKTAKRFQEEHDADLSVQGVRKAEGGARGTAIKNCYSQSDSGEDVYRPVFWFRDSDKKAYCEVFNVVPSKCYTQYGLPRTGCACCPFGSNFENELKAAEQFEPKLHKAALKMFGDSYEYTRAYRKFKEQQAQNNKE